MSTNFFSSLSGNFDLNASMSSLYGDYSQIKSGAYGSLMKSYVKKVGNGNALKAYQETGSTTAAADSTGTTAATSKKSSSSKTNFLDSHLSGINKSGSVYHSDLLKKSDSSGSASDNGQAASTSATTTKDDTTTTTDKYSKLQSSWLDDQLKQYDKDFNKTTAADTSVSMDTTV